MSQPLISAHRGGPEGIHRPNSLEAIQAAVELGVDLVEFDVRRAPDGSLAIAHDSLLPRPGAEQAPSLRSALEAIQGSRTIAHVDIKETGDEVAIAGLCEQYLGTDGFFVTTTEDESVRVLRTSMPHLSVALSLGKLPAIPALLAELFPAGRIARCSPTMLAVNHRLARAGLLRWAHDRGLRVLAWTVNSPGLIQWASEERRLWAFTTDRPRYALALRGQQNLPLPS
ncbi:glycerophosphodiester phosphodiesterase [Cryptosporangium phraense]|uniref:Glycerophosphodiester phosphodiesterase n=1 Tax=Cryptosporangium phraense TaxID=2593070 RepID=A0A545AZ71_9ACTN|nr:glycerophosphodiester phosphodiesterase [Cryptosporangium phraense]TQS46594.1 glycerophosphodiester phosphodiesterase [Cryptosporangium phraense]